MKKPTRTECMRAACWECEGFYMDGKKDCENTICPMYSYMPYAQLEPNLEIFKYNHKWKGKALIEDTKREMTDEQKEEITERLRNARKKD